MVKSLYGSHCRLLEPEADWIIPIHLGPTRLVKKKIKKNQRRFQAYVNNTRDKIKPTHSSVTTLAFISKFYSISSTFIYHNMVFCYHRYQPFWWWTDKSVAYAGFPVRNQTRSEGQHCAIHDQPSDTYTANKCTTSRFTVSVLCEFSQHGIHDNETRVSHIKLKNSVNELSYSVHVIACPDGHMAHQFLSCDWTDDCWTDVVRQAPVCKAPLDPLPPTFPCSAGGDWVPYTLVCDHRHNCMDNSDESFCHFPPCDPFLQYNCGNGQVRFTVMPTFP